MTVLKTTGQRSAIRGRKPEGKNQRALFSVPILCRAIVLLLSNCILHAAAPSYARLQVPAEGAYTGAYVDFGDGEDHVTLEALEGFENLTGKPMAIVALGSFWGRQNFPSEQVALVRAYGAVPLLFWSPWDDPYDENHGPDKYSLTEILAGKWDGYIDAWADAAAKIPSQFFVSFACEMNGTWFPWSGSYYGKGPPAAGDPKNPATWGGPETYKKAWRYVVSRVRARGATNILWVFQPNNYSDPPGYSLWNQASAYYPGPEYVDWLALSVYGKQTANEEDDKWCGFEKLLPWPYLQICKLDPQKPVMLAEWGVADSHVPGEDKAGWITEGFSEMSHLCPRLKAAVFWHERWENADGSYSNLRVNSSRASLKAYRDGVASPFWLGRPIWTNP